jgi:hypothetical protein
MLQAIRNHLFVIGINQYQSSTIKNLTNAVNDANAVIQVLQERYGFDNLVFVEDTNDKATRSRILHQLQKYQDELGQDDNIKDNLLIYFAGHGYYDKRSQIGYLVPFDAHIDERNIIFNCIQNEEFIKTLRAINLHQLLVVSDSCFSGSLLIDSTRLIGEPNNDKKSVELAERLMEKKCRWLIASALLTPASDGGFYAQNSPFTKSFVDILRNNQLDFLTSKRLLLTLEESVAKNNEQIPVGGAWKYQDNGEDLGGAFVFTLTDNIDWQKRFDDCKTKEDFEKFVTDTLDKDNPDLFLKAMENIDWLLACEKDTVIAYNTFIEGHPTSSFIMQALIKIDKCHWETAKDIALDAFYHYKEEHKDGQFLKQADTFIDVISEIEDTSSTPKFVPLIKSGVNSKPLSLFTYETDFDISNYEHPILMLLDNYEDQEVEIDRKELEDQKDHIIETLLNFKIEITKIRATIGATISFYEIVPAPGVRISQITDLEEDILFSLCDPNIRIVPFTRRSTIGFEIPNKNREIVTLREVLSHDRFCKTDMILPITLGKTISNEVFVCDLAKMPHLLIAGAIGQGKTVCINTILCSLLFKKKPSELKIILIDPKKVAFLPYSKIEKHFLAYMPKELEPIITDISKAIQAFESLSIEMEKRYDLLKKAQVKNIIEYNEKFNSNKITAKQGHSFMPSIVLVISEFADLVLSNREEIELLFRRLLPQSQVVGIHVIMATQRPSVITNAIKIHFPTRLAFKVVSKEDSVAILDESSFAEKLLGKGDMLIGFGSELVRLQGAFVDTPEIERIINFIAEQ